VVVGLILADACACSAMDKQLDSARIVIQNSLTQLGRARCSLSDSRFWL